MYKHNIEQVNNAIKNARNRFIILHDYYLQLFLQK